MSYKVDNVECFRALLEKGTLCERLTRVCTKKVPGRVSVGLSVDGRSTFASFDNHTGSEHTASAASLPITLSCFVKLFTATLASLAVGDGLVSLQDRASDLLPNEITRKVPTFRQVTVQQLLNHTHGLDASALKCVPKLSNGAIDLQALCEHFSTSGPLFDPGTLYSYGPAGMWIVAAILERLFGRHYEALLIDRLIRPLGIRIEYDSRHRNGLCPANAHNVALSGQDLLTFLSWFFESNNCIGSNPRFPERHVMPGKSVSMPGWSFEHGACVGWNSYNYGWFGHNMHSSTLSANIRVHFADRIALFVASDTLPSTAILARLFGELLPDFCNLQFPQPLSEDSRDHMTLKMHAGTYQNAALLLRVERDENSIRLRVFDRRVIENSQRAMVDSLLKPCASDVFIGQIQGADHFSLIQFVSTHRGKREYLWNGQEVFPKVDA